MATTKDHFQRLIRQAVARRKGTAAAVSDQLWRLLSKQLTAIIGEGGFNALLARSMSVTKLQFIWLADCDVHRSTESHLSDIKISIEINGGDQAHKVSNLLMITFVTNLAELIGESLTTDILNAAWITDDAMHSHKNRS